MGDQCLGPEVVVEGDRLDKFLDTAADLALVAPRLDAVEVGDDRRKVRVDLFEASVVLFCDVGWNGLIGDAYAL